MLRSWRASADRGPDEDVGYGRDGMRVVAAA